MSVATLSLGYCSYSQTKTSSYCSPAFDCKIRIYLFPNLSFAALFHVEYSSCDSLVWHTRVFYLVVLIEHIVDWNIQIRLSGERPIIHGVRLSVAYSTALHIIYKCVREYMVSDYRWLTLLYCRTNIHQKRVRLPDQYPLRLKKWSKEKQSNFTSEVLPSYKNVSHSSLKKAILHLDQCRLLADAFTHPSQKSIATIAPNSDRSWLKLWDVALASWPGCMSTIRELRCF